MIFYEYVFQLRELFKKISSYLITEYSKHQWI